MLCLGILITGRFQIGKLGELPTRRALNFLSGHLSGELDVL